MRKSTVVDLTIAVACGILLALTLVYSLTH